MEFFTKSEFKTLIDFAGRKKKKNDQNHTMAYTELKKSYEKIQYWGNKVREALFPGGYTATRKRPTNQANNFERYQWCKIYPTKDSPDELAFTVEYNVDGLFLVKIDTVGLEDQDERRKKYLDFRGDWNNSKIVHRLKFDDYEKKGWDELINETCNFIETIKDDYDKISKFFIQSINPQQEERQIIPLNQILFGPPGTGKTYNTINKALEIIGEVEVENLDWNDREKVKELFDKKMQEGQIVFSTFHQSMSYEEFIEGIKPIEPKNDDESLTYRVEPGVFKKLSVEASFSIAKSGKSKEVSEALDFSNLYDLFIDEVQEFLITIGKPYELKTKSGGTVLIDSISQQGNIIIKHLNGSRTYTVSKNRLNKLQSSIKSLDEVSNIDGEFREIIGGSNSSAYWSVLNEIKQITKHGNVKKEEKKYSFEDKVDVVEKMTKDDFRNFDGKKFVLIIDEINRGNVSQIFGELITLIEEDKRLGKDEALKVTLPYSKEKFGVPPNLYIIGTMNTADRSVEALDTALRRRFSFTEMPPLYDLPALEYEYAGFQGKDILKTINKRIEKLLDRDHLIGHSYFLKKAEQDAEEKLLDSFYRNIIPLLQEYFYGDYAKIGAVLGSGFVCKNENNEVTFGDGFDNEDFGEKDVYQIIDYRDDNNPLNKQNLTFEKAIQLLMNQKINEQVEN